MTAIFVYEACGYYFWWEGPDVWSAGFAPPRWGEPGANLGRTGFAPPQWGESGANPAPIFGRMGVGQHMGAVINREPKRGNVITIILDPPHPPTMLGNWCSRVFGVGGANRPLLEYKYY